MPIRHGGMFASRASIWPRAFLLERGVAVRQGLRFLRAQLSGILATRSDRAMNKQTEIERSKRP